MRQILLGLFTITLGTALVVRLTQAFFSDTETSTGNSLSAGAIDLLVDNTSYYNGVPNPGTSWTSTNLTDQLFFDFTDLKPGDFGEDTISLLVQNDAYACMSVTKTEDDDETCTEPELANDPTCNEPNADLTDGDLGSLINFRFWADDGDNVYENNEVIFKSGTASVLFDGSIWTLADSGGTIWPTPGPVPGNLTRYIGKYWCLGILTETPEPQDGVINNPPTPTRSGFVCDGQSLDNASQTDLLKADVEFTAIQARHNSSFRCTPNQISPTPTTPVITPPVTPSPTPLACQQADVMLVLDRSGSVNATELSQLKTAAKDFVDALALTPAGIHAGQTSFATTGSLDHILDSNSVTLKAAVDSLVATGFTNLKSGIDLAYAELTGANDRADGASPDFMIIVTDGQPNRPLPSATAPAAADASADAAKADGVQIYVVGVGSDVNTAYLQNDIASTPAHYFPVTDYSNLQTTLQNLDLCQ